jgi:hypothetical protein
LRSVIDTWNYVALSIRRDAAESLYFPNAIAAFDFRRDIKFQKLINLGCDVARP